MASAAGRKSAISPSLSLSLFMEADSLEVKEELSTWPHSIGQEESGLENGIMNKVKLG